MPDANLLEALDQLREQYNQRLKLANNLLGSLKGTASALGKAGRALREYAERGQSTGNGVNRSLESFTTTRLRDEAIDPLLPALRRETKQLGAQDTAVKEVIAALRAESVDVVKLGRGLKSLQSSKLQDAGLAALMPQLEEELETGQRALGDTFGVALRHAFAARGVELGGRPPRFELGPFELAANFVSRAATLSYGKNLVSKRVPLSVEAVLRTYDRETKAIMGRDEDPARWTEQLYTAWDTVRRRRQSSDIRANIVECYFELVLLRQPKAFRSEPSKHNFVDYSRAQFAYDFFQFTNEQKVIYQGLRAFGTGATKSQTDNPERSIWIVEGNSPYAGRYISDVKFDKDE